jgi:hypothetical protein
MSFIDDVFTFLEKTERILATTNSIVSAFKLNEVNNYTNPANRISTPTQTQVGQAQAPTQQEELDKGVELKFEPVTDYSIPVVYGESFIQGKITDAVLTNNNQTMWFCVTLCEQTGTVLSTGTASQITFEDVWYDQYQVRFDADGITAQVGYTENYLSREFNDKVKLYPFAGGSENPVEFADTLGSNTEYAYNLFPNWTQYHTMDDLVFCLVRIDYSPDDGIDAIPNIEFRIKNTLTEPGDVLYDYLTNTVYGCGVSSTEVFT